MSLKSFQAAIYAAHLAAEQSLAEHNVCAFVQKPAQNP